MFILYKKMVSIFNVKLSQKFLSSCLEATFKTTGMKGVTGLILLLSIISCHSEDEVITEHASFKISEAPDSHKKSVVLGIIPEQNIFDQKERYEHLFSVVEKDLDYDLKAHVLSSYGDVFEGFKTRRIHGAFLGSYSTALVMNLLGVKPLVTQVSLSGKSSYKGLLITRKDSGLTADIATWKGKRFAMVHQQTSAGYLFPISILYGEDIRDLEGFFGKYYFLGSHDAVLSEVYKGRADLGALKDTIYELELAKRPEIRDQITVLRISKAFPDISLVMQKDFPWDICLKLINAFLRLDKSEEGRRSLNAAKLKKFIPSTAKLYKNVQQLMQYHDHKVDEILKRTVK